MRFIITIALTFYSLQMFSQLIKVKSSEITKTEYDDCLITQPTFQKDPRADDTLNAGDMRFKILGTFKTLDSFTFMRSIPDSIFYVANNQTGWVDRLDGFPVFSSTMKEFACLRTSVQEQTISLYEIRDHTITRKFEWPFYKTATEIKCVTDSSFYVKDINNHTWKYEFRSAK